MKRTAIGLLAVAMAAAFGQESHAMQSLTNDHRKGYDIVPTGLTPKYPEGFECSPLTSLYASWIDVDGSSRGEPHSGVDGGRLNDWILAPGPGTVRAAWKTDWGWGREGALLIVHTREDLGLRNGPPLYYSEFDHLRYEEIKQFQVGQKIARGDRLARVTRPGGKEKYLEEVHWEVWEVADDSQLKWRQNGKGKKFWTNSNAHLIDPLYMLSLHTEPDELGAVTIAPFLPKRDYSDFRGFTFIFPCHPKPR